MIRGSLRGPPSWAARRDGQATAENDPVQTLSPQQDAPVHYVIPSPQRSSLANTGPRPGRRQCRDRFCHGARVANLVTTRIRVARGPRASGPRRLIALRSAAVRPNLISCSVNQFILAKVASGVIVAWEAGS